VDEAAGGAHAHADAKLSVLDVCRLSHSRLQLDHLAIHSEPAVSVMVDGLRILLRRIDPGLENSRDEEIVLVDEAGTRAPYSKCLCGMSTNDFPPDYWRPSPAQDLL
jgi:hypothetical protein